MSRLCRHAVAGEAPRLISTQIETGTMEAIGADVQSTRKDNFSRLRRIVSVIGRIVLPTINVFP